MSDTDRDRTDEAATEPTEVDDDVELHGGGGKGLGGGATLPVEPPATE